MTANTELIHNEVDELLAKFKFANPPIPVDEIAKSLKISLMYADLDDEVSGLLIKKANKCYIAINENHHPNRQRFSIAHELGHYKLHMSRDKSFFIDRSVYYRNHAAHSGQNNEEIEANRFAAELLMPKKLVLAVLNQFSHELSDSDLVKVANKFFVSQQAMKFRLAGLGLIDPA